MTLRTEPFRRLVSQRARHQCEYCHYPESASNAPLPIDHIYPQAKGGETQIDNLALACWRCNTYKLAKTDGIDHLTGERTRLFNPRLDDWDVHFHLNIRTGEIEGRTPVGRTTAQELAMNQPLAVANRMLLIEKGLFTVHNEP